ncbi:MAG: diol dehydratase small subunit, partial [Anaerolineae bacterium]|nr:diol dehydratase small subunit [Anaerolineae bacterium]
MNEALYPLMQHAADDLKAFSGRPLLEVTLEAVTEGALSPDDMRIQAETLRLQAQVAEGAGYLQLAANLRRAAELTVVPNNE